MIGRYPIEMGGRSMVIGQATRMKLGLLVAMALAVGVAFLGMAAPAQHAYADQGTVLRTQELEKDVESNGFKIHIWYSESGDIATTASIAITGYTGSSTEISFPASFTVDGKTVPAPGGHVFIQGGAFAGSNVTKIAIQDGVYSVGKEAFKGCANLTEVALGTSVTYIGENAFAGCPNLKTYYVNADSASASDIENSGIGQDASGTVYPGVTVYTKSTNTGVIEGIRAINGGSSIDAPIKVVFDSDPYSKSTVSPTSGSQMGEDGTALGKGASADVADKFLASYERESDPAGTKFSPLNAKITKVTKNSLKLTWASAPTATNYVVYGNACGKKNSMVKLASVGGKSITFKKVNGKAVKKGTYYKFIVVAFDANNRVVSSSKSVHAATKGGKVGNDKKVTTAAKKNKVTVKKGKSFKLKAKAVPASKSLKVKRHRKVAYESTDTAVATVNGKGVIKGVAKGSCVVYAYAQNGVYAKVKVTVAAK